MREEVLECREINRNLNALMTVLEGEKLSQKVRDRLNPDIRRKIVQTAKETYQRCRLDDNLRFDLQVALGNLEKVKELAPLKARAVMEAARKGEDYQKMIDRPTLIALEMDDQEMIEALLPAGGHFAEALDEAEEEGMFEVIFNPSTRIPYYSIQLLKMGRTGTVRRFLATYEYLPWFQVSFMEDLYNLAQDAQKSRDVRLAQLARKRYQEYAETVLRGGADPDFRDLQEFLVAHPVSSIIPEGEEDDPVLP